MDPATGKPKVVVMPRPVQATPASEAPPRVAFLRSVTIEGFRGIGEKATLDLTPGPGLTLVVGRNGSGKSSFAEGLELLLTSQTYRWKDRSAVWKGGFRNLHHKTTALTAQLALEGEKAACTVAREWADGAALEAGETWAQVHGQPRGSLKDLGWSEAFESYRPFLSYNELGSLLDEGPSQLYDALARILGLEDLVRAQSALKEACSVRDKAQKDVEKERKELMEALAPSTDPRSVKARVALGRKEKGLADLELAVLGSGTGESEDEIQLLRRLSVLPVRPVEDVKAGHQGRLRSGGAPEVRGRGDRRQGRRPRRACSTAPSTSTTRTATATAPCAVAPGRSTPPGTSRRASELLRLQEAAKEASEAKKALAAATAHLRSFTAGEWPTLERAAQLSLGDVSDAAKALLRQRDLSATDAIHDPEALARAVEQSIPSYMKHLMALHVAAASELTRREDAWRPFAQRIQAWLPRAFAAYDGAPKLALLKQADKWLKETAEDIRNDRFAPIADHAKSIWDQLKLQSNVSLARIQLKGDSGNKLRKVELDVTVDGQEGAALGVMSQGELHSLALSLFVPRATLPESPFRFIVIDDPVQSMDPSRVDGLARVLQQAAQSRQVLVFTHDDRLPEAIRRLDIAATIIEVTRGEGSRVATRRALDPVARYVDDAMALAYTDDLPAEVARRVVPGLCREAIEAACMEAIRRRRIGRGEPHAEVEALLARITSTKALTALALFDDEKRAGDVLPHLNKQSRESADTFRAVNEGSHDALPGPMIDLVKSAEKLARWLVALS